MRPLKRDVARVRAIQDQLKNVGPRRSVLEEVLPAIGELLHADKTAAYTVVPVSDRLEVDLLIGSGWNAPGCRPRLQALLSQNPNGWTGYNPYRPEPDQRNVAIDAGRKMGLDQMSGLPLSTHVLKPSGVDHHDHLRVLVCERETLLAYVGGWRHEALFTHYERHLLQALAPELRRALILERQMGDAPRLEAALDAALDSISGEAYVLDARGAVSHANAAGRARLDREPRELRELLTRALRARLPGVQVTRLVGEGMLVVRRGTGEREARVAGARTRYALTARQAEVLGELARGRSNSEIGATLKCSLPTVESHLRALFEKMECESRAGLLARLLE